MIKMTLRAFAVAVLLFTFAFACTRHFVGPAAESESLGLIATVCVDAGDPDVLVQYPIAVTTAFCTKIQSCCAAFPDAGTFDEDKCTDVFFGTGGFDQTYTAYVSGAVNSGNLVYDSLAAKRCFDGIAAIQCQNNPATSWRQVRQDCWSAMNGVLAVDGGCATSFECAPGLYCNTGHCDRIKVLGESCASHYECTYQQNGLAPSAWCNGTACTAQVVDDAGCGQDRECQSGHCVLEKCSSTDPGVDFGICHYFAYP